MKILNRSKNVFTVMVQLISFFRDKRMQIVAEYEVLFRMLVLNTLSWNY